MGGSKIWNEYSSVNESFKKIMRNPNLINERISYWVNYWKQCDQISSLIKFRRNEGKIKFKLRYL